MRRGLILLAVVVVSASVSVADIHQPWTTAETGLFSVEGDEGSGWSANTLTLARGSARTDDVFSFLPEDAIGISFGVSASTPYARFHVTVQEWSMANEFLYQHGVITREDDWDFSANVNSLHSQGPHSVPPIDYWYDVPESTTLQKTMVDFLFLEDLLNASKLKFKFAADNREYGSVVPGVATYHDISWIIYDGTTEPVTSPFDVNPVPLPGAALIGVLGLGTAGWRLRRIRRER